MKVRYIITICVLLIAIFSCFDTRKKSIEGKTVNQIDDISDKLVGKKVIIPKSISFDRTSAYLVLVFFDGNCSQCIGETLNWIEINNKSMKSGVNYLFLSNSNDTYEIELHMKKFNILLTKNEYLIADVKGFFMKKNQFLDTYKNILLLNKENIIISSKDPFESEIAMNIYKKYGIF